MKQLLDILAFFKEYLVLALCILVSIVLLSINDSPQIRNIRSIAVVAVGFAQDMFSVIPNYFSLKEENRVLRERNVALADQVSLLRQSKLENIRLRELIKLKERTPFTYVAANVIGKNQQLMRNTITLDVGERNGVKRNMAIVTDAGLVGKIVTTSGDYSIGQLMLHKDFRASAQVERDRTDGIIAWDGGEHLILKNVPRTANLQKGDVIVTSDFSTIFPAGIRVGVIANLSIEQGALFHSVEVAPAADFARLEEVFVVTFAPDSSRLAIEKKIQ